MHFCCASALNAKHEHNFVNVVMKMGFVKNCREISLSKAQNWTLWTKYEDHVQFSNGCFEVFMRHIRHEPGIRIVVRP
jgi:hypothetical protein